MRGCLVPAVKVGAAGKDIVESDSRPGLVDVGGCLGFGKRRADPGRSFPCWGFCVLLGYNSCGVRFDRRRPTVRNCWNAGEPRIWTTSTEVGERMQRIIGTLGATLMLTGCSGADSERAKDADIDFSEVAAVSCSSIAVDDCREGEQCVFGGSGSCSDWLGTCEPVPSDCEGDWGDWRASLCGRIGFSSTCAARASGRGGPLRLATTIASDAAECDPTMQNASECGADEACVLVGDDGQGPTGQCLTLEEICRTAPSVLVCATPSMSGSIGTCWPSPCVAWRSGYRGLLSVDR